MKSYIYTIPLKPIPLQRARSTWKNKRPYDPQKQDKSIYSIYLHAQTPNDFVPLAGPLRLDAQLLFKVADSNTKKARAEQWNFHIFKPDTSNCIKFLEDILVDAGILSDDAIICSFGDIEKLWTFNDPYTIFRLTEL